MSDELEREITKLLYSNTLEYIKNLSQFQQALAGVLLTSYTVLLVNFKKPMVFSTWYETVLIMAPIALFVLSLVISYFSSVRYKGSSIEIKTDTGVARNALELMDKVIQDRRSHLTVPSLLTLAGMASEFAALFLLCYQQN